MTDSLFQEDDEEGGEAYDLAKMSRENDENQEEEPVKVHEIKFDEYGIMDDGLEASTNDQLKSNSEEAGQYRDLKKKEMCSFLKFIHCSEGATAIDEDLFEDEDLEELEEDLQNLDV